MTDERNDNGQRRDFYGSGQPQNHGYAQRQRQVRRPVSTRPLDEKSRRDIPRISGIEGEPPSYSRKHASRRTGAQRPIGEYDGYSQNSGARQRGAERYSRSTVDPNGYRQQQLGSYSRYAAEGNQRSQINSGTAARSKPVKPTVVKVLAAIVLVLLAIFVIRIVFFVPQVGHMSQTQASITEQQGQLDQINNETTELQNQAATYQSTIDLYTKVGNGTAHSYDGISSAATETPANGETTE